MIEQLFGSKTRVKLLQLFFSNPNRSFYVREITRKIDEQINSVRRELSNLLSIGIISSDTNNNRLYYEVDQNFEYYKPLSAIFGGGTSSSAIVATKGEEVDVPKVALPEESDMAVSIRKIGNVELALLTGSFTRDFSSGIDLLIVGDLNKTKTEQFIAELEEKEGKIINYSVFSHDDFMYRRQVNDRFLNNILMAKYQKVVDKNNLLAGIK